MRGYSIILLVFICGCSLQTTIIGKYASRKQPDRFEFKRDSSFLYEYRSYNFEYSAGTWKSIDKRTVILNSNIKSNTIPMIVNEKGMGEQDNNGLFIRLNIKNGLGLLDYMCYIFVNDTFYVAKRCDSLSSVMINKPIQEIFFRIVKKPLVPTTTLVSMPLSTETYQTKNKICNLKIETTFSDSLFSYRLFNNERLKVSNNKIKIFNSFTNKWEGIPKVPVSTKIFTSIEN